ncbi:MAG: 2-iminobutanoate/2-iminopropanoate deaminase [Gaiellales bacterium]|nr:2-iminobutanoate/2-iminopropanoate deaminase [Gaiellales bacterium]
MNKTRIMPKNHWDWSIPVPLSQGWVVENLLFVGGQISADDTGRAIGVGDIEVQTRNVFQNITTVLNEAGADWDNVVKLNTYYVFNGTDEELTPYWEKMTRVRMEFLRHPGPAATAVRVAGLIYPNLLIEAEVIAVLDRPVVSTDGDGAH